MNRPWQAAVLSVLFTLGGLYRGEAEFLIVAAVLAVLFALMCDSTSGRHMLVGVIIFSVPLLSMMFSLRHGAELRCSMFGARHQVEARMDWQIKKCLRKTTEGWVIVDYAKDEK